MAGGDDSLQSIGVRLDGKNYSYWSYVMTNFLKGKGVWDYVSGKTECPKIEARSSSESLELFQTLETNNSKIITWINNSVEQRIGVQLAKFTTAKEIWSYLCKLFVQNNFAIKYQLQSEIRGLVQNNLSIQDYFCAMTTVWDQLALTESVELQACVTYVKCRDENRLVRLLMGLRSDFENCRSSPLHRKLLSSVEDVVHELMAEENRLKSLKGVHTTSTSVLSVSSSTPILAAPARQFRTSVVGNCHYCKELGHWKDQCPELPKRQGGKPPQSKPKYQHHGPVIGNHKNNYSAGQQYYGGPSHSQSSVSLTQAALLPSMDHSTSRTSIAPTTDSLAEQFQQFLAFQQYQKDNSPYALAITSSSSHSLGLESQIQESDLDRT